MLQLTYISSATPGLPITIVGDILSASRRNNAAAGVTGLLLFDGRRFLQALEGPVEMVNQAYARIRADPRHRAIVLLSSRDVEERAFGTWAMAAQAVAAARAQPLPDLVDALTAEVADPTIQALFRSFATVRTAA